MAETEMKWYVMRAISGDEGKVKNYIEAYINQHADFAKHVAQVLVPTEKVVTIRNGKRVVKEKNRYAGYVFVQTDLVGETQANLRNVPGVLGFLSDTRNSTKPMPLRPNEVSQMLGVVDELKDFAEDMVIPFSLGESVKVTDGPFTGFDAIIEDVNSEKKKLKVSVKIFGRKTPLELNFMQVEKL
ncbi:MAG: transcription termination/antitermination protein NusG [Prevotellaceae bacterium]|nr:transcription termination/antitermination protein NusG [Prevotellaceae bacterium]